MTIQLYIDYISQPSRAVLAFCILNNIPYTIKQIRIAKMQNLDQNFKEVNPMRRVPAIRDTDNGLTLGESPAIMAYLARKYKKYDQFRPDNEMLQARIEEYLHYHHGNTRKCSLYLYSQLFSKLYPAQLAITPDEKVMQAEVEGILGFLDSNYFKDSEYMIGNSLTVADLLAYFQVSTMELVNVQFSRWKNLERWIKKMDDIPSVKQANQNYKKMAPKMQYRKKPSL